MKVVVIGGGYAGVAAALRMRRRAPRALEVMLVNESPWLVERIRLHQRVAGQALPGRALQPLLARAGVRFIQGRAEAIDLAARTVRVGESDLPYDRLVVAVGSHPAATRVPGARRHATAMTAGGAAALAERLQRLARVGGRLVVVGAGLTGVETATEIAQSHPGLGVVLLSEDAPFAGWSEAARAEADRVCAGLGIRVRSGVRIEAVEPGAVRTVSGHERFDACIWAAGFEVPALPREAGLALTEPGQMAVDATLRSTSHPEVYAAGDIAGLAWRSPPVPMGCKSAMPMGAHVGDNVAREALGRAPLPFDYAVFFYCVSLGRRAGVIQWPVRGGRLVGRAWTGRRAAVVKELVSRATWWALDWESRGWNGIAWKQGEDAPIAASSRLREA